MTLNSLFRSPIAALGFEYIILDRDFTILDFSPQAIAFADEPEALAIGGDIRSGFPELIGAESSLLSEFFAAGDLFQLEGINKSNSLHSDSIYINLYITSFQEDLQAPIRLLVLLEDTTEQMQVQQKLVQRVNESSLLETAWEASQAYLDKIINSMADALLVTGADGTIKKLNPAAAELFDYDEAELINAPISLLSSEFDRLPQPRYSIALSDNDVFQNIEISCVTKSGREIVVVFSCSMMQTEFNDRPDLVYLGKDITKRVQAEAKLQQAFAKERELSEIKSRLVSTITHELRTPLNTILFASELLRDSHASDLKDLLDVIDVNVKYLTQKVDDVLSVSHTDLQPPIGEKISVNLQDFCQNLIQEIELSQGKVKELKLVCPEQAIEERIVPTILRHILLYLLADVVKYSGSQSVVYLKLSRTKEEVIFEVEAHNAQPQLRSQPLSSESSLPNSNPKTGPKNGNSNDISPLGLGLAMIQKYVGIEGGRIEVKGEIETGLTFQIALPRLM
jgi:PAS domain S-box-containing protein